MADVDRNELYVLHQEFEWVLAEEVPRAYSQLQQLLEECVRLFPINDGASASVKAEKFIMAATPHTTHDSVKAVVSVTGDAITHADISLRLLGVDGKRSGVSSATANASSSSAGTGNQQRTSVTSDAPWRLQQIQDAFNYVKQALLLLRTNEAAPKSSAGVLSQLGRISHCLQSGRQCLLVPRRKTIEELLASINMRTLTPPLPPDTALSFYIQAHKLVLAVYQVGCCSNNIKFESVQAECALPWLGAALGALTTALHFTHSLKDKVTVFAQYKDFIPDSCSVSTVSC